MTLLSFSIALLLFLYRANSELVDAFAKSQVLIDRLITCDFENGQFQGEQSWQSACTLEAMMLYSSEVGLETNIADTLDDLFNSNGFSDWWCYDDMQWWLLGWVSAYKLNPDMKYLKFAAKIFDYVVNNAWNSDCGGGVIWCPARVAAPYKNTITNTLFLTSAMRLHPYTSVLNKPEGYYLNWANTEWNWFKNADLKSNIGLYNDGLTSDCKNNNNTIWTYNQGVILSGLALLSNVNNDSSLLNIAMGIADAVLQNMTTNGILHESCEPTCDGDQVIFKGVFVRHLTYMMAFISSSNQSRYSSFVELNSDVFWNNSMCINGFGENWSASCGVSPTSTATMSAALDLFNFNSMYPAKNMLDVTPNSQLLGLGKCIDSKGYTMSNYYNYNVSWQQCYDFSIADTGANAFDFFTDCYKNTLCRIRTKTIWEIVPSGWSWEDGVAEFVSRSNGESLTSCFYLNH